MFEHLDDPKPPQPRQLLVECVVAEGARRRRRRAVAVASVAATIVVVTSGVSLAQMSSEPRDLTVTEQPDREQPDGPDQPVQTDQTPPPDSGDVVTQPDAGGDDEGATPAPPGASTFAGITANQEVVLADATTGAVTKVLVPTPTDGSQITGGVALSPEGDDVYYVRTEQDETGEYQYSVMRVSADGGTPSRISRGTRPAISADGKMMAYVRGSTQIVLREVDTGHEQVFRGLKEGYRLQDLGFLVTEDDRTYLLYTASAGEGAPAELFALNLLSVSGFASLTDAVELGPSADAEEGTGWSAPDVRADGSISVVEQCCALGGDDSYNGGASIAFVDASSGERQSSAPLSSTGSATVLKAPYDHSGQTQLVLSAEGDNSFRLERRNGDGSLETLDQAPAFLAVDW